MAVIKEYKQGECTIRIHDDAIRPPEEIQGIIDRASRIVLEDLRRRETQKLRKEKDNVLST